MVPEKYDASTKLISLTFGWPDSGHNKMQLFQIVILNLQKNVFY